MPTCRAFSERADEAFRRFASIHSFVVCHWRRISLPVIIPGLSVCPKVFGVTSLWTVVSSFYAFSGFVALLFASIFVFRPFQQTER